MLLDQVRARNAFAYVLTVQDRAELLQLARKLPAMFQTNGLLASWAHLLAKKDDATAGAFLGHFREVGLLQDPRDAREVFLNVWSAGLDMGSLQRLTAEAVIFAAWLKRAAEALCDTGDTPAPEERT